MKSYSSNITGVDGVAIGTECNHKPKTTMSELKELTELEKAQELLNAEKQKRAELFHVELQELLKKHNVSITPVPTFEPNSNGTFSLSAQIKVSAL